MGSYRAPPATLMQVWRLYRNQCRPIGQLTVEARAGILPGVEQNPAGTLIVTNRRAAIAAMSKE
ncbi:MAG: hypothetical protein R3D70_25520 [Rhizobiaceae bacterium]